MGSWWSSADGGIWPADQDVLRNSYRSLIAYNDQTPAEESLRIAAAACHTGDDFKVWSVCSDRVLLFVEESDDRVCLSIQGSANATNWKDDFLISFQSHPELRDTVLHTGFYQIAADLWDLLGKAKQGPLGKEKPVVLTGHSLGGAVAVVLAMIMHQGGYTIYSVVTFGQPKVTDNAGCHIWEDQFRLVRVRRRHDPIALLPPGVYQHFGSLLHVGLGQDNKEFAFAAHPEPEYHTVGALALEMLHAGDHHIAGYMGDIWGTIEGSNAILEAVDPAFGAIVQEACGNNAGDTVTNKHPRWCAGFDVLGQSHAADMVHRMVILAAKCGDAGNLTTGEKGSETVEPPKKSWAEIVHSNISPRSC